MDSSLENEELRAVLPFILHSTPWTTTTTFVHPTISTSSEATSSRSPNPGFHSLIDQVLYSRRFTLGYHVVLDVILLIWAVVHWGGNARRAWKRRKFVRGGHNELRRRTKGQDKDTVEEDESESSASSSFSCTLGSAVYPPYPKKWDFEEDEPLLREPSSHVHKSWLERPKNHIRSWLVYQPKPLPFINKTLPSNCTSLAVLILWAINIFFTFYKVPLSTSQSLVFADRAGLMFVVNLPHLYFFSAKNQPIKLLTGYSYEACNILHRRLGEIMCLLALLHSVGMIVVWYTLLRSPTFTLARFLLSKIVLLGIGALVAYEALYFTSLGSFRRKWYELFLKLHVGLQVIGLILLWFHHHGARIHVDMALAIFIIDRFVYRMTLNTVSFKAAIHVEADKETVGLRVSIPLSSRHHDLRRMLGSTLIHSWKPTHHVFLTIPSLSREHALQAHPFTIASRAPPPEATSTDLDLIIRAQAGFSADLLRYAQDHSNVTVRLDGPYGSQQAVDLLLDSELSVIVAGGSGIAVAYPLVWSILDSPQFPLDLEVSRTKKLSSKKILLVWIVQKASHISWIGESRLTELRAHGVELFIPSPTSDHGRPDIAGLVESWIVNQEGASMRSRIGVVCSGPDGMNRAVRNRCSALLARGWDVDVEIEKFGW